MYKDRKIVERISEIMTELQLTQKKLESDIGIDQSSISQMLGLHRSALPLIKAMSKVYGINRNWLLTGLGEKYSQLPTNQESTRYEELIYRERLALVKDLNSLQFRHQDLMNEACKIMENVLKVNARLMYGNDLVL